MGTKNSGGDDMVLPSRNSSHKVDVTLPPNPKGTDAGEPSDGESVAQGFGVGTTFKAVLNERPNKSINRNNGSDVVRAQANTGMVDNGGYSKSSRRTGKVGS